MLGGSSPEAVADERVPACEKLELFMRDDDVQEAGHRQIEQLQSSAGTGGAGSSASNRTAPQ